MQPRQLDLCLKRAGLWWLVFAVAPAAVLLFAAGCTPHHAVSPGSTRPSAAPTANTAAVADGYVGDAACAPCHPSVARQHSATAHAATLSLVTSDQYGALFRSAPKFDDAPDHETFHLAVDGQRCELIAHGPNGDQTVPAELAVGSGRDGLTFLGHADPVTWVTLRLSYYAAFKQWRYSPNQQPGDATIDNPTGRSLAPEEVAICIKCHVTDLRRTKYDLDLAGSHIGIGCEACHGAGRAHSESAREMAAGSAKRIVPVEAQRGSSATQIEQVCARCHSTSKDTSHTDQATMDDIVRFEATALEASTCYRRSKALSCVSCHDPHSDVSHETRTYEAACLRCHGGASTASVHGATCPVNPRNGCIKCHMPEAVPKDTPSHPFHNHWIRVYRKPVT